MITESNLNVVIKSEEITRNEISYEYELRSFESRNVASFGIVLYELCAKMTVKSSVTFYRTGGIFSDLDKALRFFELITKNLASPYHLPYIIEDFLSF